MARTKKNVQVTIDEPVLVEIKTSDLVYKRGRVNHAGLDAQRAILLGKLEEAQSYLDTFVEAALAFAETMQARIDSEANED